MSTGHRMMSRRGDDEVILVRPNPEMPADLVSAQQQQVGSPQVQQQMPVVGAETQVNAEVNTQVGFGHKGIVKCIVAPQVAPIYPVLPAGLPTAPIQLEQMHRELEMYLQCRRVRWNWRFSLTQIATDRTALTSTFPIHAAQHMGVPFPGRAGPQFLVPIKVSLVATENDAAIPMLCNVEWLPYYDYVTNCGQRATHEVPTGARTYNPKEYVIYEATEEDIKFVKNMKAAFGRNINNYMCDVVRVETPEMPEKFHYLVKANTDTYHCCRGTYPSDVVEARTVEAGFVMNEELYNHFFGKVSDDLVRLGRLMKPLDSLTMKLDLLRPARSAMRPNEPVNPIDLINEVIALAHGDEPSAKSYYYNKENTIAVTMLISYIAVQ